MDRYFVPSRFLVFFFSIRFYRSTSSLCFSFCITDALWLCPFMVLHFRRDYVSVLSFLRYVSSCLLQKLHLNSQFFSSDKLSFAVFLLRKSRLAFFFLSEIPACRIVSFVSFDNCSFSNGHLTTWPMFWSKIARLIYSFLLDIMSVERKHVSVCEWSVIASGKVSGDEFPRGKKSFILET